MTSSVFSALILALILACLAFVNSQDAPLVPALIIFGDSTADVGNNNNLRTFFKANYPPYGRDFDNEEATGRFSNGKLALDFTAETLGFTTYPPAYLSPDASEDRLLLGANFASAASGYDDRTAELSRTISLNQQLEYFREYKDKLEMVAGENASSIIEGAIYVLSTGSSDFVQNYYSNPFLNKAVTVNQYSSQLINLFSNFVQELYHAGARKLGVSSLPPLGCVPATRSLYGFGQPGCVLWLNNVAKKFNQKLNTTTASLQKKFPAMKIALFDVYEPLLSLVESPYDNGFFESSRSCCGTGTIETTIFLCTPRSLGTCANASGYVFWDSASPSEAANKFIADSLVFAGLSLL